MAIKDRTILSTRKGISLFLPAYNEEENIERVVGRAAYELSRITDRYEIIVVNDGSSDDTGTLAEGLAAGNDHVRVVHHPVNLGYGAALKTGINAAQLEYVAFTDADGQFDLSELKEFLRYVPKYQAVLGYRRRRQDNIVRIANSRAWHHLMCFLFGMKVRDIDCAFKLFDRRVLEGIELKSHGAMISAELLARLNRKGVAWKEIPVTHRPRLNGEPTGGNIGVIVKAFREMIPLYWGDLGNVTQKQALKFGAVGVANTLVDILAYALLTRFVPVFGSRIVLAKGVSFILGTISSFNLNRRWTFGKNHGTSLGEVVRFYSTVGVGLLLNVATMHLFATVVGMNDIAAAVLSTGATFVWNFVASKVWVFGARNSLSIPDDYKRVLRQIVNP